MADFNASALVVEPTPHGAFSRDGKGMSAIDHQVVDTPDEDVPATVGDILPNLGDPVAANQPVELTVLNPTGLVLLLAEFPFTRKFEVVFNGTVFGPNYSGTATVAEESIAFVFSRVGGWPKTSTGIPEWLRLLIINGGVKVTAP